MLKLIYASIILILIYAWLIILSSCVRGIASEIRESRVREDLLLQEVKLLDYQINVLTNHVMVE